MARSFERLNALQVERNSTPGFYPDGAGLYLRVKLSGSKSWVFRYMRNKKSHDIGLGPYPAVGLAAARLRAGEARRQLAENIDPLKHKRHEEKRARLGDDKDPVFKNYAEKCIQTRAALWKGGLQAEKWRNTMEMYVYPIIGPLHISMIDTAVILKVLQQEHPKFGDKKTFWMARTPTADNVRNRIEIIIDSAMANGAPNQANPARWERHLEHILPAKSKIHKVRHFAAINDTDIGTFLQKLKNRPITHYNWGNDVTARILQFLIFTVPRVNECTPMDWTEIDIKRKIWTIPWQRIKKRTEARGDHRVPLSEQAFAVLGEPKTSGLVFPSPKLAHQPLAASSILNLAQSFGYHLTTHGFRATFKTWVENRTHYKREIGEVALTHTVGGDLEDAYQRGDLFMLRSQLMQEWANFSSRVYDSERDDNVIIFPKGIKPAA